MASLGSSQRDAVEPGGDRVDGGVGLFEVDAVAGAANDDEFERMLGELLIDAVVGDGP